MKKLLAMLLCCLLLAGCAAQTVTLTLYTPNDNADGFVETTTEVSELTPEAVFDALIAADVLHEDVAVNSLRAENGQIALDVNEAFLTQLRSYGTTGEFMMVGCVVNTLLTAFEADTVYITCEGQIMESGHVIYDYPLEFHEGY